MYKSIVFTVTSALALALVIAVIVMQVMEMRTYQMLPF